jgi:hypothetical protein
MSANPSTHIRGSKLRVPAGSASHPISRIRYRLGAPLRWYQRTIVHIVVLEICSLIPRSLECIRDKRFPVGAVPVDRDPRLDYRPALAIARACNSDMEELQLAYGVNFPLGLRLYAKGFSRGASWMLRSCTEQKPEGRESSSGESITRGISQ